MGSCQLKVLTPAGPRETARMSSLELREHFLVDGLFEPGRIELRLIESDRIVAGGAVPESFLALPPLREIGTSYFLERREAGIMNIGAPGIVRAGADEYRLGHRDCLYLGMGIENVEFGAEGNGAPLFYLFSCPAHRAWPAAVIRADESVPAEIGRRENSSLRSIRKYICPETVPSCQLTMGITELAAGNVWNTWPPHTHSRRSEVYLYFDLGDATVLHLMGRPDETRHIVIGDRQAVASPPWSIHTGVGTKNYSFIWGMAGENQSFNDIDPAPPELLR